MATKKAPAKKAPAKKKTEPTLELRDDGFWWITDGKTETNAGRSRRYAENMLAEQK